MKVFLFDLLPYGKHMDHLAQNGRLPWPFSPHIDPEIQVRTYAEHLDAWEEVERVGFDGIAFNEHHGTPYGLMTSPNLLAAAISQRTKRVKILILGNLLPIHDPLRLAEEIAMLDNLTGGRIICGVARGIPREYKYFNIPLNESRARFNEAYEIMKKAWTEDRFTYNGQFHSYNDISILPRPVQKPHPPVWVPIAASKDSIEWAAANDVPITPGSGMGTMAEQAREDIIIHYAKCLRARGVKMTPDHLSIQINCYVADSKAQAVEECGPYVRYLFNYLFPYDQGDFSKIASSGYNSPDARGHLRAPPAAPPRGAAPPPAFGAMDEAAVKRMAQTAAWGTPDEVAQAIIREVEATGAGTVLLMCNVGAMPQHMFLKQIRRLGEEVLPRLKAHKVKFVPAAEALA
ncbi:MAG TPA: LLM class flavin-dependent oxidoreductase [Alphaproteobacteria bacterium]|nr:LLM class flavin-dependent oxidoreductase [Alphaproteobacteria bacterium]